MKPEPVDAVQAELFAKLEERAKEGALQRTWRAWSLGAHLSEWLLLATAPGGDVEKTKTDPVLSEARTPRLYEVYIEMLFIGLSDNTTLESFVSLYKTFAHCNMDEMTMDNLFQYHSGLAGERAALCAPEMRSEGGGALRPEAKEQRAKGKPLPHPWRSKKQLRQLCRLTRVRRVCCSSRHTEAGPPESPALHSTIGQARSRRPATLRAARRRSPPRTRLSWRRGGPRWTSARKRRSRRCAQR
jgi:hypothetical protein